MAARRSRAAFLVADDNPVVAALVSELLREAGVEVVGPVYDGAQALRLYREALPEGAILDFDMPEANGLEVLRTIRAEHGPERCKVIILTGHTDPSLRDACLAAGADHFLRKDEADQLIDLVRTTLRSQSTDSRRDI